MKASVSNTVLQSVLNTEKNDFWNYTYFLQQKDVSEF